MPREICHLNSQPDKGRAILRVARDTLDMGEQQEFRSGCRKLLDTGQAHLFVDLRDLRSLLSIYLDIVLEANSEAKAAGRRFTVLVGEKLGDLFRTVVGPELLELALNDPE
jgi:hypothetical protein